MITFLPSTDFEEVAKCLDDKRLGAQRYEAWSILKWLRNPHDYPKLVKAGYCVMWEGYEDALVNYINAMLIEWAARGFRNDLLRPFDAQRGLDHQATNNKNSNNAMTLATNVEMPPWLGADDLHSYHRHALVSKLPHHYRTFGWSEDGKAYNGSYLWPVPKEAPPKSRCCGWVLRWPKAMKLPSLPISVSNQDNDDTAADAAAASARTNTLKRRRVVKRRASAVRNTSDATTKATAIRKSKRRKTMTLRSGRRL